MNIDKAKGGDFMSFLQLISFAAAAERLSEEVTDEIYIWRDSTKNKS